MLSQNQRASAGRTFSGAGSWRRARGIWRAAVLLFAVMPSVGVGAQDTAIVRGAAEAGVIRSIREFWALTPEQRMQPQRFEIECDVTYFDPLWKNLWVQDRNHEGVYAVLGGSSPAIRAGQRILATGVFQPPNRSFSLEHAEFKILGDASPRVIDAGTKLSRSELLNRVATVEAFVVQQRRVDPAHLHLSLSIAGRPVFAWLLLDPEQPVPSLADSTVKIRCVVGSTPGAMERDTVELKIADVQHVEHVSWLRDDRRFDMPITPIETLPDLPARQLVRVAGEMLALEPGRFVRIRDATGQVDVITAQVGPSLIGQRVQAVGLPKIDGMEWRLESGLFRPLSGKVSASTDPTTRVAAEILQLPPEDAAAAKPVRLTGVVTWSDGEKRQFYLQDTSGGVAVALADAAAILPPLGRRALVEGVTAMGDFAPIVSATQVGNLGDMVLPSARPVSLESALTGVDEAQWVEMRGYVRDVKVAGEITRLELVTSTGAFVALVAGDRPLAVEGGAVVRLHGVCTAVADDQRRLSGIQLLVPSGDYVQVEDAAPTDVFELPTRRLATLGQFGTLQLFNRRVKIAGVVLHFNPGRYVQIADGEDSLFVMTQQTSPLAPGDRVEAAGILGRLENSPVLREAVYRKTGSGPPPEPARLSASELSDERLDGRFVRVEARLIESAFDGREVRLALQARNVFFDAYIDGTANEPDADRWVLGSRLAVTGIYEVKYAEEGQTSVFQIRLRGADDVVVLERPSPLTRDRVLTFAGALGVGILLFVAWVVALRRRVRRQTDQIREQLQRETRLEAELQRATKLESLGLLAGGIAHDFNNLLTVVMGNLSLATIELKLSDESARCLKEAERAIGRARDLTQQLLTFAKGGAPLRAAVMLEDVVREVAEFALRGSKVRCTFQIARGLWPADVDKGQISQVVQNIVINGMQAMPAGGEIVVSMQNEIADEAVKKVLAPGRYLKLRITDHGSGIRPEDLPHVFDPYFTTKKGGNGLGLATVHSIVKKHHGHITVQSEPGSTTFEVWLPAANEAPAPVQVPEEIEFTGQGRILFMDDDPAIRELGIILLRKFGYEPVVVPDGAAAVRAYREAMTRGARFDLVILDLTVPGGMGGREAMEQLRAIDPSVRALVSSGYSNDAVLANFRSHGFQGMVAKPYEATNLAETISRVLRDVPV